MVPSSSSGDPLAQARSRLGGSLLTSGCGLVVMIVPVVVSAAFIIPMILELGDTVLPLLLAFFVLPFLGVFVYTAWSGLRAVRALAEISNQALAGTPGEVVWTGRAYALQAEGLKLRALPGVELMPGRYAFSYLPGTGFVIEAKPTGGIDRDAVTFALGAVFKFTPDDLSALRAGQIAPDHRARLQRNLRGGVLGALVGAAVFVALGLFLARMISDAEGTGVTLYIPALAVAAVLLIVAFINGRQWQALDRGEVGVVEGLVRESTTSAGRRRSYWFEVAGKRFRVSPAAHTALVQGQDYRLYFLKGNNQILALEPVNQP
jgi:hypothetical protein